MAALASYGTLHWRRSTLPAYGEDCALLDGFLFSADYQSGKKGELTSPVAANFVGWEQDHALFDRELGKVIRALRTGADGREKPPPARL